MSQICFICKNALCNSICEQIKFKLIQGKTGRKEDEKDPNKRDEKKTKEKDEEENLEPFTQEPISELAPKDVFRVQQNVYSLPDLYNWVINIGNPKIPLTGQIAGQDLIEQLKEAANQNYPLILSIHTRPDIGMNLILETRRYTTLATIDSLSFRALEISQGIVVETIMEFMQTIVHLKKGFFIYNDNFLQLVKTNKTIAEIQGINNQLVLLCKPLETSQDEIIQLRLCIEIAESRGKGYDMFQIILDDIIRKETEKEEEGIEKCVLKIVYDFAGESVKEKFIVKVSDGESYYDAYIKAFESNYDPGHSHDFWTGTLGIINGNVTDMHSKGEFPYSKNDFDEEIEGFDEDKTVKVTITEEYWPPTITIDFYRENIFKTYEEVDATSMAEAIAAERTEQFSNRFEMPSLQLDSNKNYKVTITMVWNKNKQVTFAYGTTRVFERIFYEMEELSHDFNEYAGPGINEPGAKWKIRVDIDEQKTIMSCISCGTNAKKACGNLCGTMYCGDSCARKHWDMEHYALCLRK
jgi:hypothetical protein